MSHYPDIDRLLAREAEQRHERRLGLLIVLVSAGVIVLIVLGILRAL